jgi:hypothetical protein
MSAQGVSVSFRVICVLIVRAVESMCFQGLFGAVTPEFQGMRNLVKKLNVDS